MKLRDLGDCPLCFGRLLPLSVCQSCNTIAVRDGLDEVGPTMLCEDCGAANATHFVCSACNARFPYGEIVKPEGPTCPVCKNPVPPGVPLCPHCSAVLPVLGAGGARQRRRVQGEWSEEDVVEVGRISGIGRQRAEALCAEGYNALWKIARATEAELARVKGIGTRNAAQIKEGLRFLLIVGRKKSKEEVLSEEYECPLCGTITSLFATRCHDCGAVFAEEEIDEEFRREVEREEEKGLLAYYDVRLLEDPSSAPLHYARGALLLGMGRPAEALASFERALELDPAHARALQAKVRALAGAKGIGGAAQVLRDLVATARSGKPPEAGPPTKEETEALAALGGLAEEAVLNCPECGERQVVGSSVCPVCGYRFAHQPPQVAPPQVEPPPVAPPESTPFETHLNEDRLLDELERAVAGEAKAPPPPLRPEVPKEVVDRKRSMLAFLLRVPGVSRRAAEAVSGFFQDLEQVGMSEAEDLAEIPGVAPAEARLIISAATKSLRPLVEDAAPPPKPAPPRAKPPARKAPVRAPAPLAVPEPPRPATPKPVPTPPVRRPLEIAGRRGLINGHGLVNGRGRVNGLINGTGFVNGSSLATMRLPRQHLMPRYFAIAAAMLMVFGIAVALIPPSARSGPITIDGSFADWTGVSKYTDATQAANASVQIARVSVKLGETDLFLRVAVRGPVFSNATGYHTVYAFIASNPSQPRGYDLVDMRADYLLRVSGAAGRVEDARLMYFTGNDSRDWNGWTTVQGVSAVAGPDESPVANAIEVGVPIDSLGPDFSRTGFLVRAAVDDNVGLSSHLVAPIRFGFGSLVVEQTVASQVIGTGPQVFLRVWLRAYGESVDVDSVWVAAENGTLSGPPPGTHWTIAADGFVEVDYVVDPGTAAVGAAISGRVIAVNTTAEYVVVGPPARAYLVQSLTAKRIDGLFADWGAALPDSDPRPVRSPSLDILARDASVVGNTAYLYASLNGPVLDGGLIAGRLLRPVPSGGGGGNSSSAGPIPPAIGQDYVRFYLRTNPSVPDGFGANGLFADRLVEVRGRGGLVANASAYRWSAGMWRWDAPARVGLGSTEIEMSATMTTATFNATSLVAVSGDWAGVADSTSPASTRGGTRGAPKELPIVMGISINGPFQFHDANHATETDCTSNKVASSSRGSGPMKTMVLEAGNTACWYIDETSGATIPAGGWETLLDVWSGGTGAAYDVKMEVWNKDTDTVAEQIVACTAITTFGNDVECFATGVPRKTLTSNQVVRVYIVNSGSGPSVSIEYDDGTMTGDAPPVVLLPEFTDLVAPLGFVLIGVAAARRIRRVREARQRTSVGQLREAPKVDCSLQPH